MKVYKTIKTDNGVITYYGSNKWIQLHYAKPEWSDDIETYFRYRGNRYYLSEIMRVEKHASDHMKEFHGCTSDSYFSGVVIKLDEDGEAVKAYTYIS